MAHNEGNITDEQLEKIANLQLGVNKIGDARIVLKPNWVNDGNAIKGVKVTLTDMVTDDITKLKDLVTLVKKNDHYRVDKDDLVELACKYAIGEHRSVNQFYGDKPYEYHLKMVADTAEKYRHLLDPHERAHAIAAAWGHDLIEDARQTYNDVKEVLGKRVADLIYLLTNNKGKTRAERAGQEYMEGLASDHVAKFVKLCDIYSNTLHSSKVKGNMYMKYKKELPKVKEYLYEEGQFEPLWEDLESL